MSGERKPRRIVIIGNAGTGKSTMARQIAARLRLPAVHIDQMLWGPGWKIADEHEFRENHSTLVRSRAWIIEGIGYVSTIAKRIEAADLVIVMRYPLRRSLWWSLKRQLSNSEGIGRPAGCGRPPLHRLIAAIWRTHTDIMPQVEQAMANVSSETRVVVLRSLPDARRLLASLVT